MKLHVYLNPPSLNWTNFNIDSSNVINTFSRSDPEVFLKQIECYIKLERKTTDIAYVNGFCEVMSSAIRVLVKRGVINNCDVKFIFHNNGEDQFYYIDKDGRFDKNPPMSLYDSFLQELI